MGFFDVGTDLFDLYSSGYSGTSPFMDLPALNSARSAGIAPSAPSFTATTDGLGSWGSTPTLNNPGLADMSGLQDSLANSVVDLHNTMSETASGIKTKTKFRNNPTKVRKANNAGAIMGAASDLLSGFIPEKSEYDGKYGNVTQTMDSVYDNLANAAAAIPGIGTLISGVMKGGALLGKGADALGMGTDAMTIQDSILGSSFFQLTPFGIINGALGDKTQTFTKDNDIYANIGSSYTGAESKVDKAVSVAGKKYGLLSKRAEKKANKSIDWAMNAQRTMGEISDEATTRNDLVDSMSVINSNRYNLKEQGGVKQGLMSVGRQGLKVSPGRARRLVAEIPKVENGERLPYEEWIKTIPEDFQSQNYDLKTAYERLDPAIIDRWTKAVQSKHPKRALNKRNSGGVYVNHLNSVAPLPDGDMIFLKLGQPDPTKEYYNPELHYELDWYQGDPEFQKEYDLKYEPEEHRYYYRRKVETHKEGGTIDITPIDPNEIVESFKEGGVIDTLYLTIEEIDPFSIEEFQKGGSINVIPEGALHARKNNIDLDGITEKGIPVISESEGGDIQQHAEIERGEITLRLAVTQKLEELEKQYYSDIPKSEKDQCALEAGKLLVDEILHNTEDNTNELI